MWAAGVLLHSRGVAVDQITVAGELERQGKLAATGGAAYMSHLVSIVPTSLDAHYYAEIVRNLATHRRLIMVGQQIMQLGFAVAPEANTNLAKADELLVELRKNSGKPTLLTPQQRAEKQWNRYTELESLDHSIAVSTGLSDLDDNLGGGLYPGDLIVVGGRAGMGKTSFLQFVGNYVGKTKPVLFASGEMNDDSITDRDIAGYLGIPIHVVRRGHGERTTHTAG